MASTTTTIERVGTLLERLAQDDDFRDHASRSYRAGRGAAKQARGRKSATRPSVIKRAGVSVAEAGQVLIALGQVRAEPQRKKRRGAKLLALTTLAGAGAGFAYLRSRGDGSAPAPTT